MMNIVQAAFGTFHHFDLARELRSEGHLKKIYSTYPWRRLKREGIPRELVSSFPWLHMLQLGGGRLMRLPRSVDLTMSYMIAKSFDSWIAATIPECDAFVGLSASGLKTGALVQRRGGKYVCDRGSSHIRYQDTILKEEYARWGWRYQACDPRIIEREEAEYAEADAITIASEFSRSSFLSMGVPAEKIHKIMYGVRLDHFTQTAHPANDSFDVLFAGQVSLRKGIPYLVEAFRKFRHPKKRLRLVGSVDARMREILNKMDLTDIELTGSVGSTKLAEYMNASHVLVLPSIEDGFGLVMAQAMACGCPVIASQNSGGPDLVTDGVNGFVVPIRQSDAIKERLQQMADTPELQQRMSEEALRRVSLFGGWKDYGKRYTEFLKTLTGKA